MTINKNDVIQVNENMPDWCGCLMIVDEVEEWGVLARTKIPFKGIAYLRLKHGDYVRIGKAVLVPEED